MGSTESQQVPMSSSGYQLLAVCANDQWVPILPVRYRGVPVVSLGTREYLWVAVGSNGHQ